MSIHHLQTQPDSCVAAAMCMIQRWRSEAPGTRNGYHLLDPFYPGDTQPLEVSDDDFVQWFTGYALIASR